MFYGFSRIQLRTGLDKLHQVALFSKICFLPIPIRSFHTFSHWEGVWLSYRLAFPDRSKRGISRAKLCSGKTSGATSAPLPHPVSSHNLVLLQSLIRAFFVVIRPKRAKIKNSDSKKSRLLSEVLDCTIAYDADRRPSEAFLLGRELPPRCVHLHVEVAVAAGGGRNFARSSPKIVS